MRRTRSCTRGIATNLLSDRLRDLDAEGLVQMTGDVAVATAALEPTRRGT